MMASLKESVPELEGVAAIPRDEEGPVFAAPWEARTFALVRSLCEQGHYRWKDFQKHLIVQIAEDEAGAREAGAKPPPYYESFQAAALKLFAEATILDPEDVKAKIAELR